MGELYDLQKDPYQLDNLYNRQEYNDIKQNLMETMEKYMLELDDSEYD